MAYQRLGKKTKTIGKEAARRQDSLILRLRAWTWACKNAKKHSLWHRVGSNWTSEQWTEPPNNVYKHYPLVCKGIHMFITDYTIKKGCGPMCVQLENS